MAFLLGLVVIHYLFVWASQRWRSNHGFARDDVEERAHTEAPEVAPDNAEMTRGAMT